MKLSPSGAARRMTCPGSHQLLQHVPKRVRNDAALAGSAAHYAAMHMLRSLDDSFNYSREIPAHAEYVITSEMITDAEIYVSAVIDMLTTEGLSPTNLDIEQRVEITAIHETCVGYIDACIYSPITDRCYIIDYKSGFTPVSAVENWQLLEYAIGVMNTHPLVSKLTDFRLVIVQPNDFSSTAVKTWDVTADEITRVYYPRIVQNELLALQDNAPCVPSPMCKTCDARAICPALHSAALSTIDYAAGATPERVSNDFLGFEIKHLRRAQKLLEARLSGLEEEAFQRIKSGQTVAGFKLQQRLGAEKWICDINRVIETGKIFGINLEKPRDVITPTQARKAGLPADFLSFIAARSAGALKLVEQDEN